MLYLLTIVAGLCIGAIVHRSRKPWPYLSIIALAVLLSVIFLMGLEVDIASVNAALLWRAAGIAVAAMLGSVVCLITVLSLLKR